ncbi:MAG: Holliday junction branch migration protein RuvA [Oscillospiraceae bacterium]|nr:Holliday junction branch migration protein RuvA [Oscillospiraceae bacterium]
MIYFLKGVVEEINPSDGLPSIVMSVGGVGYDIKISYPTSLEFKIGEESKIYTYLHVREDCVELYGFKTIDEKAFFKLLISVSGVGTKVGISILSDIPYTDLYNFIDIGDTNSLTGVKGIGKKTAERIILELKDRIKKLSISTKCIDNNKSFLSDNFENAIEALVVLGYSYDESSKAVFSLDKNFSLEELIKESLKILSI